MQNGAIIILARRAKVLKKSLCSSFFRTNLRGGEDAMSNYVITIARGYGSGGKTIGKQLAAQL